MNIEDAKARISLDELNSSSKEEGLINKIPISHVFPLIFSYLNTKDLQSVALVCKKWNTGAIEAATQEIKLINEFQKFLMKNYPNEKISIESTIPEFCNLRQVKSSILGYREKIINILKNLEDEVLKSLQLHPKNTIKPKFFGTIFELTRLYKKIDKAALISDATSKSQALSEVSIELVETGEIAKGLEIAKMIPISRSKSEVLSRISSALIGKGEIDKAFEIAKTIPEDKDKFEILSKVSNAFIEKGEIDKGLAVAKMIPTSCSKSEAPSNVSSAFKEKDEDFYKYENFRFSHL